MEESVGEFYYYGYEGYRVFNMVISMTISVLSFSMLLSLFFPLYIEREVPSNSGPFIFFEDYAFNRGKLVSPYGITILCFMIVLFALALTNFIKLSMYKGSLTKVLFWLLLAFFYFPISIDVDGSSRFYFTTLSGTILSKLTTASINRANAGYEPSPNKILSGWYFLSLISLIILYVCFVSILILHLYEKNLKPTNKPKQYESANITIVKITLATISILLLVLMFISMLIKTHHWVGTRREQKYATNLLSGYIIYYAPDNTQFKRFLRAEALFYLIQIISVFGCVITYLIFKAKSFNQHIQFRNVDALIIWQLSLLLFAPTSNLTTSAYSLIPGFIYMIYTIRAQLISLKSLQDYYPPDSSELGLVIHGNLWLLVISIILLVVVTLTLIAYCIKPIILGTHQQTSTETAEITPNEPKHKQRVLKFCPNCGYKLSKRFAFCPRCGQKLANFAD